MVAGICVGMNIVVFIMYCMLVKNNYKTEDRTFIGMEAVLFLLLAVMNLGEMNVLLFLVAVVEDLILLYFVYRNSRG